MAIQPDYSIEELTDGISASISVIDEYYGIPSEVMNRKLNPETWSCSEVCRHLIQFNRIYLKQMNKAIENTNAIPKSEGPYKVRWFIRKFGGYIEPPYKFAIKTLAPMRPSHIDLSAGETTELLIKTNNEVLEILEKAGRENWNLTKIRARNPVFKCKMSLTEFVILLDAHQRRHFWQIEQILKRLPVKEE